MELKKKHEILITTLLGFAITFSGVFLAFTLDRIIQNNSQKNASLKMIEIQSELCSYEQQKFQTVTSSSRPLYLPATEVIGLIPTIVQFFADDIKQGPFIEFRKKTIELELVGRRIKEISMKWPGQFYIEPIRAPHQTDADWRYQQQNYLNAKKDWESDMKLLDAHLNTYKFEFKSLCAYIGEVAM